jgi:hypothetical protein
MAEPLIASQDPQSRPPPRTVLAAKVVDLVMVTYTDEAGTVFTQLGVAGENEVHLLEGRASGLSKYATPQGRANDWLADGIFKKLDRKRKKGK